MHEQRFHSRAARGQLAIGFVVGLGAAALVISSCGGGSSSTETGTAGSSGGNDSSGSAGQGGPGVGGTTGSAGSGSPGAAGNGATGTAGTIGTGGSGPGAAGAGGSAGVTGTAGSSATGTAGSAAGRGGTTGAAGRGGATGTAGSAAGRGGTTGTAGTTGAGGAAGSAAGRGGATGSAGATGTACNVPIGPRCSGAPALNPHPFGCNFAWGRQNPSGSGSLSSYNYLQMVAYWIEPGVRQDGTYPTCSGCNWLSSRVSSSNLIPVYYAYMIGYYGHSNGLPDQNINPNGANLATGGAALIKANRQKIIDMYANYARQTRAMWPTKPLVWFLEGDFIQYTEASQTSPLTMAELGQLAADITCAIKSNMPNAVVAMNHTTWNGNDETNNFWCEMRRADLDLVWTTGVGNNGNFIESAGTPSYYNAGTATYAYVHTLTGKNIVVDTSYGASAMSDSWSNQTATVLNNHITNGVIGVNIANNPPSNYQTLIGGLAPQLMKIPDAPCP
jgi:hypothetical protein